MIWNLLLNPTSLPAFLFRDLWVWMSSVSDFVSVCFDQAVYSMGTEYLLWERKGYLSFSLGLYLCSFNSFNSGAFAYALGIFSF